MKNAFILALALLAPAAMAAPYIPQSGTQVIETIPRSADPQQQELKRLRAQLSAAPRDLAQASALAQRYIAVGRKETDPRYFGYAQGALAPWWTLPSPPAQVLLLRATLLQNTHRFGAALADLDALTRADPANPQAWLTRATVQTVVGDYAGATASCARLSALADGLVSFTCLANVANITGRLAASEALLDTTLQRSAGAPQEQQVWVLTLLAEMATRRGDAALADTRYRRALALSPRDSYLLGAYADFLLDQRRPGEVLRLLKDLGRVDALLLRYALALKQDAGAPAELQAATRELEARFNAAAQRGDSVHRRERSRYELFLRERPATALALARKNWEVQKEPADTRILLEAALGANDKAAAAPVLAWLKATRLEDVAIGALARRLGAGS